MKKAGYLVIFFLFIQTGYSQITNIQPFLRTKGEEGFKITLKTAPEFKSGNTDVAKVEGGFAGRYVRGNHLFLLLLEGAYAEALSEAYMRKTFEHLRYRYKLSDLVGLELFSQHEYDEFRRIDLRALGGAGPRFTFLSSKIFEMAFGTAYMLEFNRNSVGAFSDSGEESTVHRWSSYLHFDLDITKKISFFSTTYIQPRFDQFSDFRFLNDNSLNFKIAKHFTFFIKGFFSYDSRPPQSVESLDVTLQGGFGINYSPKKTQNENQ